METKDYSFAEIQRLFRENPKPVKTAEEIDRHKRYFQKMMNSVCRREGIIIPSDSNEFLLLTRATTLPPQVALDDFMNNTYESQINTLNYRGEN